MANSCIFLLFLFFIGDKCYSRLTSGTCVNNKIHKPGHCSYSGTIRIARCIPCPHGTTCEFVQKYDKTVCVPSTTSAKPTVSIDKARVSMGLWRHGYFKFFPCPYKFCFAIKSRFKNHLQGVSKRMDPLNHFATFYPFFLWIFWLLENKIKQN